VRMIRTNRALQLLTFDQAFRSSSWIAHGWLCGIQEALR
jgi:hypothetical protein